MPRINWGTTGERYYELGVDCGVLYVGDAPGVAWTGLTSVSESPTGGEAQAYYIDGVKYLNLSSAEEFEATINAFSSPPEFGPCDGTVSIQNGLFVTQQPRKQFGFSYRTKIGNDVDGTDHAYKIHLVYNALAAPSSRDNNTTGDSTDPTSLGWAITTLPPSMTGYKPTAHFVIDTRKTLGGLLKTIEDILYGSDASSARIPTAQELIDMFSSKGLILRTNLASDPAATTLYGSFASAPTGAFFWYPNWYGSGGATGTTTIQTGPTPYSNVTTFMRKTWTSSVIAGDAGFSHGRDTAGYPMAADETFTISSSVRTNASGKRANIRFRYYDSAGVLLTKPDGIYTNLVPNEWTRISYTNTAPAGTAWVAPWTNVESLSASPWQLGDTFDGTALLIEKGNVLGPYFDGSTLDHDAIFFDWEGTPNNSPSVIRSWDF